MFLLIGILFYVAPAYCEEYFSSCESILYQKEYIKLKKFFEMSDIKPKFCQRLNNNEFLYTTESQFYYCKDTDQGFNCQRDEDAVYYPNLKVEKRFSNKAGKQFVLFKSSKLSSGYYGEGFTIFHFVQKVDKEAGYALYRLAGAGESNGKYSEVEEVCSNMESSYAINAREPHYEIIDDQQDQFILRFNQDIISCDSNKVTAIQALEYIWKNNRFRLLNDSRKY